MKSMASLIRALGTSALVVALFALAFANVATAAIYTWDGGGGANDNWSTSANWVGDSAPPTGLGHVIKFNSTDVGNLNVLDTSWTGLGLTYENTTGVHTTDLSGNTLTLSGTGNYLRSGYNFSGTSATIQNGTVSLGTSGTAGSIVAGYGLGSSSLIFAPGTSLNAYISTFVVAQNRHTGTLDLSGTAITTGGAANTLQVSDYINVGTLGSTGSDGTLLLPTSLTAISAANSIIFGGAELNSTAKVDLGGAGTQLKTITARDFTFGNGKFGYDSGGGVYVLPEGVTLNVGSSATPGILRIGYKSSTGSATLALPNGTLNAYLTELTVGRNLHNTSGTVSGTLDLSSTAITTGGAANTLQVSDYIYVGTTSGGSGGNSTLLLPTSLTAISANSIIFGDAGISSTAKVDLGGAGTQLKTITARDFAFGAGKFGYDSGGGVYVLPEGVTLNVGSSATPGILRIGYKASTGTAALTLANGTLNAYLTELTVGHNTHNTSGQVSGTLDLSTASSVSIIVTGSTAIGGKGTGAIATGVMRLPSGSSVTTSTLTIGTGSINRNGKLYLVDTDFAVTGATDAALNLGGIGTAGTDLIDIKVQGASSGLDIQGSAASVLSVGDSGRIDITFAQDPFNPRGLLLGSLANHNGIHYGLKWAGDHVTVLTNLGAKLAWNDTTYLTGDFYNAASIFYDTATDATYVGFYITVIPEPSTLMLLVVGGWLLRRAGRKAES